jgi:hypothetical protein
VRVFVGQRRLRGRLDGLDRHGDPDGATIDLSSDDSVQSSHLGRGLVVLGFSSARLLTPGRATAGRDVLWSRS